MNTQQGGNQMLNRTSFVSSVVIVKGRFAGIVHNVDDLEDIILTEMPFSAKEDWIPENVSLFPVLSTTPLDLTYSLTQVVDTDLEEGYEHEIYTVEELGGEEFDTLDELKERISDVIKDGDYTREEVERWEIEKRITCEVNVSFETTDSSIAIVGYPEMVSDFVMSDAEYDIVEPGIPTPPKPYVNAIHEDLSYVTRFGALERVKEGKYVYIMDGDTGIPTNRIEDVEGAIERGQTFARLMEEA